ncbi:MAG TPA: zinc-binding dehydrogenase [Thermoanaerobaculia bacterium]|nr:zinc-binding dehydrogenase [Thermoanaerobaculia bacterium]
MRAIRLVRHGAPLIEQDIADPEPRSGEVLIEIRAAGICHSDAHYRHQPGRVNVPRTLGHEIAGVIAGTNKRVAAHYLLPNGGMIGKEVDGGYAEKIVVPEANAIAIPDPIAFEQAAIMMCSTATAYHALRLALFKRPEYLAILGFGGLGISALQLGRRLGASRIQVAERVPEKLALAAELGAISGLRDGVDVALDFVGNRDLCLQALRALRPGGRLVLVAINLREFSFDAYADVLAKERHIIGCSDHTREELIELMQMDLDLSRAVTRRVPLDADAINEVLEDLDRGTPHLRTIITI